MRAGVVLAADVEVVGGGDGDVVGHAESVGLGGHVLLPAVGRHVEPVLDGGAAEVEQVVAERVAGGALGLGDGEGGEVPGAVPAPTGRVLGVGQPGALHAGAERPHARRGGPVDGLAAVAVAVEEPLGHQAAQARPDLVAGEPARVGHRVELVGHDRAVVVGHARAPAPGSGSRRRWWTTQSVVFVTIATVDDRSSAHARQSGGPCSASRATWCGGRTPSCRGRPSGPSGDRRDRWRARCRACSRSTGSPGRSAG